MNTPAPPPVRHPLLPVKTPRAASRFTLRNPRRLAVIQLEPEQFFPAGELNCDYVFQVPEAPAEIYVELKGGHFSHALAQLANTIRLLRSPLQPKHCFVVIRRSPAMDAKTARLLLQFSRQHRCLLHPPKTQYGEYEV